MDTDTPPGANGQSSYRYTYNTQGEVMNVSKIDDDTASHPPTQPRPRIGRQSVFWPFQSIATSAELSSPASGFFGYARSGSGNTGLGSGRWGLLWNRLSVLSQDADSESNPRELIPDYIVNFIRGETPATIARRHMERIINAGSGNPDASRDTSRLGAHSPLKPSNLHEVGVAHQHQHHHSRSAELDGFSFLGPLLSRPPTGSRVGGGRDGGVPPLPLPLDLSGLGDGGGSGGSKTNGPPWGKMLPDGEKQQPEEDTRRFWGGWRGGVVSNVILSGVVLVATLICFIVAAAKATPPGLGSETVIYTGSCGDAGRAQAGLLFLVNLAVIILLAGSSYIFQVVTSPTRSEVSAAHSNGHWLHIGIPSLRNLPYIAHGRRISAMVIMGATIASQVIYNSVIIPSQSGADYLIVFATETFPTGGAFTNSDETNQGNIPFRDLVQLQELAVNGDLVNITTARCPEVFGTPFSLDFDSVIVITDDATDSPSNSSLLQTALPGSSVTQYLTGSPPSSLAFEGHNMQYCMARPSDERTCTLNAIPSFLGIAVLVNLISTMPIAIIILASPRFDPLATLGDAISSFLRDPDATTRKSGLLTKEEVASGRCWDNNDHDHDHHNDPRGDLAQAWLPSRHRWFQTPSFAQWFIALFFWLVLVAIASAFLESSINPNNDPSVPSTTTTPFTAPFSIPTHGTLYFFPTHVPTWAASLATSLGHLFVALLYLAVSGLLTTYHLSHELSLFAYSPRSFRVSHRPQGAQTSSFYLTLPRPWSWLLLALFLVISFLVSHSIFILALPFRDPPPASQTPPSVAGHPAVIALVTDAAALTALLGLLAMLVVLVLGLGFRTPPTAHGQAHGINPLAIAAGSCSAIISARCFARPEEGPLWTRPLVWGVVARQSGGMDGTEGAGRCGFSAHGGGVEGLKAGRVYV